MKNLIILLIILSSCSPIKRHNRLVNKFPYVHTVDSVILIDTISVIIPSSSVDTTMLIKSIKDTITLDNDTVKVNVYIEGESIYVKGECKTDTATVIVTQKVPIKYYKEVTKNNKWLWIVIIALVLLLFFRRR